MPEGGPAFIHDLGLALGIEVLPKLPHDADDFPLPGFQQGRVLLDEVENVLLGLLRIAFTSFYRVIIVVHFRNGAPEIVDAPLLVFFSFFLASHFFRRRYRGRPLVPIHPVVHQGVAGIQDFLHGVHAIALLALRHVMTGKHQVIDDRAGVGPGAEQVVTLEEGVVAIRGMGNNQRLHRQGVFLHQVGDAGIGVDHDLVGQAHLAALIALGCAEKLFAEGPVMVANRHAHGAVGVHHLLGADHLDLVRVGVQAELGGALGNLVIVFLDQLEGPLRARGDRLPGPGLIAFGRIGSVHEVSHAAFLSNSWRNTG